MSRAAFAKTFVWSWFFLCLVFLAAFLAIYLKPYGSAPSHHQLELESLNVVAAAKAPNTDVIDLSSIVVLDCDMSGSRATQITASPILRRCFDQLLYTSQPVTALEQALKQGLASQIDMDDLNTVMQLWQQYHLYFVALKAVPNLTDVHDQHLESALLRQKHFSAAQRKGFFGQETPWVELQLEQYNIMTNPSLKPVDKAQKISELLNNTSISKQSTDPLKNQSLKQLQHELRVSHASAEDVKQVLDLLS